jgi:adenine-specific DNA methylase
MQAKTQWEKGRAREESYQGGRVNEKATKNTRNGRLKQRDKIKERVAHVTSHSCTRVRLIITTSET